MCHQGHHTPVLEAPAVSVTPALQMAPTLSVTTVWEPLPGSGPAVKQL